MSEKSTFLCLFIHVPNILLAMFIVVLKDDFCFFVHQENMSVKCLPPQTPLLYSKTGVRRGIPIFLIFAPKHRLWVLVRTASPRRRRGGSNVYPRRRRGGSNVYPQSMF